MRQVTMIERVDGAVARVLCLARWLALPLALLLFLQCIKNYKLVTNGPRLQEVSYFHFHVVAG
jgi:hypothetical protein